MNENRIYKGIIIIALIAVLAIMYQHYVVLPDNQMEAEREQALLDRQAEREAEARREQKLDQCLADAYTAYSANWDAHCVMIDREKNCSLPRLVADDFDQTLEAQQDQCLTRWAG